MKSFATIAILIPCILLSFSCKSESKNWDGSYIYESEAGETVSETPVVVTYRLAINGEKCQLSITGYQVDETILCNIKKDNQEIAVNFSSYNTGKVTNIFDVQVYEVGVILFRLERQKTELTTTWESMQPDGISKPSGTYFMQLQKDI